MKSKVTREVLISFLIGCIALSALAILFFEQTSSVDKGLIGVVGTCMVILLYFFYLIKSARTDQLALQGEIRKLRSNVGQRTLQQIENEKIYRSLAANIPGSAITILDREERYLLAEGDMLVSMGYKKENMPGRKISEVITPENYIWYKVLIDEAFSGKTLVRERRTLSGLDALIKVVPLKNEENVIYAIMFVLLDVTVVKKVQLELAELNSNLETRIAERTQELVDLNRELETFTYSVSHDLRAPLRGISGYAKILQEDQQDNMDDSGRDLLNRIIDGAARINLLINDFLEFSKLGRAEMTLERIDMNALVTEIVQELAGFEGSRKLNIRQLSLHDAAGDPSMVRQVWVNLISNALKYSRKKESTDIEIESRHENGSICFSIRDNGAGFDMAHAEKLFGVFQRLHTLKEFEGTGVGLALVKTIIKRHGGKIWAESRLNEGAKFYFTLPPA